MSSSVQAHIRWMIRRDMPHVLEIERQSFEFPWTEEDFVRCLRQRNSIGMVAEVEATVAGFMIYELHKTRRHLLNFAVDPVIRRCGVGSAMVTKLQCKTNPTAQRSRILLEVRETNLTAQLFFSRRGFRATSILKNYYEDTDEDAYLMQYSLRGQQPSAKLGKVWLDDFATRDLPEAGRAEGNKDG